MGRVQEVGGTSFWRTLRTLPTLMGPGIESVSQAAKNPPLAAGTCAYKARTVCASRRRHSK